MQTLTVEHNIVLCLDTPRFAAVIGRHLAAYSIERCSLGTLDVRRRCARSARRRRQRHGWEVDRTVLAPRGLERRERAGRRVEVWTDAVVVWKGREGMSGVCRLRAGRVQPSKAWGCPSRREISNRAIKGKRLSNEWDRGSARGRLSTHEHAAHRVHWPPMCLDRWVKWAGEGVGRSVGEDNRV